MSGGFLVILFTLLSVTGLAMSAVLFFLERRILRQESWMKEFSVLSTQGNWTLISPLFGSMLLIALIVHDRSMSIIDHPELLLMIFVPGQLCAWCLTGWSYDRLFKVARKYRVR